MEHPEEKTEKTKLTLKQRKWLEAYMATGNATEAAFQAYDLNRANKNDESTASSIGSENLRKLDIPLNRLLDEAGLTDVYLTLKLKENLNATKLYGKDSITHMDGMARNKALEIALKIKGKLIDKMDHTLRETIKPKVVSEIIPRFKAGDGTTRDNLAN